MRILWVTSLPSQLDENGLSALRHRGHTISRIYTQAGGWGRRDPETGAAVSYGDKDTSDRVYFCAGSYVKTVRALALCWRPHPGLAIVNGFAPGPLLTVAVATRVLGVRTVVRGDTVQHRCGPLMAWLRVRFLRWLLRRSVYAYVSEASRVYALRTYGLPEWRMIRMPYLLSLEALRIPASGKRSMKIVAAARLNQREGGDRLLDTAKHLLSREEPFELVVLGSGELHEQFAALAEQDARLTAPGWCGYDEYLCHLGEAKVFAHLPRREPWGASISEALALGTAVAASWECIAGQELMEGKCGDLFEYVGPADAATRITSLIKAPAVPGHVPARIRGLFDGTTWVEALEQAGLTDHPGSSRPS
jgi:glycosyltransferase involved in cell wall biosynthesis